MVHFIENWKLITSDQKILSFVSGYSIEFDSNPFQTFIPVPIKFNESETETIDNEISDLFKRELLNTPLLIMMMNIYPIFFLDRRKKEVSSDSQFKAFKQFYRISSFQNGDFYGSVRACV